MGWYATYIGVFKVNKKIPYEFFWELSREGFKNWMGAHINKDISHIIKRYHYCYNLWKYIKYDINLTDEIINKIKLDKDPNISKIMQQFESIKNMAQTITIGNQYDFSNESRIKVLNTIDIIKKYIDGERNDIINEFYNKNKKKYKYIFSSNILLEDKNDNDTLYYCYFKDTKYGYIGDNGMDIVIKLLKKYDIIVELGSVHVESEKTHEALYFGEELTYLEINNNICKYVPYENDYVDEYDSIDEEEKIE